MFTRQWKRTRYYALRSDGYVLLFYAASCGAVFLLIATVLSFILSPALTKIVDWWHLVIPIEHSGKAAMAFLLASTLWIPLNWGQRDEVHIDRVIQRKQDSLELLLRVAMGERKLVLITVKNGKIYVGYIISNLNPAYPMESLGMLPMMSGYRRTTEKTACFTTLYTMAYDKIEEEIRTKIKHSEVAQEDVEELIQDAIDEELCDFKIVIPITEIQSASIFKLDIYEKYFRVEEKGSESTAVQG